MDRQPATAVQRPAELRIPQPDPFNGERRKAENFLLNTQLYLWMNAATYNNDMKKISFVLSLMKESTAGLWKRNFIQEKENAITALAEGNPPRIPNEGQDYGLYANFLTRFRASFISEEVQTDARIRLQILRHQNR